MKLYSEVVFAKRYDLGCSFWCRVGEEQNEVASKIIPFSVSFCACRGHKQSRNRRINGPDTVIGRQASNLSGFEQQAQSGKQRDPDPNRDPLIQTNEQRKAADVEWSPLPVDVYFLLRNCPQG